METIYEYIGHEQPIPVDFYLGSEDDGVDLSQAILFRVRLALVPRGGSESTVAIYSASRTGSTQRIISTVPGGVVQRGNRYYLQSYVTFSFDASPFPGDPIYFYVR